MLLDKRLEFSDAQSLTGTAASTNLVDLRGLGGPVAAGTANANPRDVGAGGPLYWVTSLDVLADGTTGDETYTIALQSDDATAFGSAATVDSFTIPRSTPAGTIYARKVPAVAEQFVRAYYTLAGTTPSVTLSSYLTNQPPEHAIYADAI